MSRAKPPHKPAADSSIEVNITNAALQHPLLKFLPNMLPVKMLSRLRATCSTMKALTNEFPGEIWLANARLAAPRWVLPKLVYAKDGRAAQALLADQAKKYASTKWRQRLGSGNSTPVAIKPSKATGLSLPWPDSLTDETS